MLRLCEPGSRSQQQENYIAWFRLLDRKMLVVALASVVAASAYGQSTSNTGSTAPAKQCDGTLPAQKSVHPGSSRNTGAGSESVAEDTLSAADGAKSQLKLSIRKNAADDTEAEGQFCKRERPGQNSLKPAVPSRQADDGAQSSSSETTTPPVAQLEENGTVLMAQATTPPDLPPAGGQVSTQQQGTAAAAQPEAPPPIAQVTDGKLSIHANGQPFGSVLDAVRSATGIAVEMPDRDSEPVFMNLGPVPMKDALMALVEGTRYNYMIVGSPTDAQRVTRLVLSARSGGDTGTTVAGSGAGPAVPQVTLYGGQGVRVDPDAEGPEPADSNVQTPPNVIPSSVPTGVNIQQLAAQEGKSPGQILDELQKRQEQMLDQQAAQAQSQPQ